jgi:hypothetical protein
MDASKSSDNFNFHPKIQPWSSSELRQQNAIKTSFLLFIQLSSWVFLAFEKFRTGFSQCD